MEEQDHVDSIVDSIVEGGDKPRWRQEQNQEETVSFLIGLEDSLDHKGWHGRPLALVKAKLDSQEEEHEDMLVSNWREQPATPPTYSQSGPADAGDGWEPSGSLG